MSIDVFGTTVSTDEVEDAVLAQLQEWFPTYLAWTEQRKGLDPHALPVPRSWNVMPDVEKWPEYQLPAIIVVSPGTTQDPVRRSRGIYRATYGISVAWYISASDQDSTRLLNRYYAGLIRTLLLQQKPVVNDELCTTVWTDEDLDALPTLDSRTIATGRNVFDLTVDHVVESEAGPRTPADDPYDPDAYPDAPTILTTFADGDKE